MSSSTCLAYLNIAISEDAVLNTEVAHTKKDGNCPGNKSKRGKKLNNFRALLLQFQAAAIQLDAPILHRHAHSAQLHKVLQDPSFTATYLCPINTFNRVDHTQVLCLMHDIRKIPTFPHSVTKKVEEKVEEKIVLIHDVEHPLFEENNFGAISMNGSCCLPNIQLALLLMNKSKHSSPLEHSGSPYSMSQVPLMTLPLVAVLSIFQVLF